MQGEKPDKQPQGTHETSEAAENGRKHPDGTSLEEQQEKITEVFDSEVDEEVKAFEKKMLAEGVEMSPEEMKDFYESLPDLFEGKSPEFAQYFEGMTKRLSQLIEETGKLKQDGNEYEAIVKLADFIGKESESIEKIKDPESKNTLFSFLGSTLDIEKIVSQMKKQTTIEAASSLAKCLPGGTIIDVGEAVAGKTLAGEKMGGGKRVWEFAKGATFLALDVSGFISAGGGTAISTGIKALKGGEGVIKAGKTAMTVYKETKAAKETIKIVGIAGEGARIASSVTKFAGICNKVPRLGRVASTMAKVGGFIQKYPRLAGFLVKANRFRTEIKDYYRHYKMAKKGVGVARTARRVGRLAA